MVELTFKVEGLLQRGGFVWQGCPDAVCAAVQTLPGVGKVDYDAQLDRFSLEYDPERLELADIFAAVVLGGKKMGQEYRPILLK